MNTKDVFASISEDLSNDLKEGCEQFAAIWPKSIKEVFERGGTRGSEPYVQTWKPTTAVALANRKNPILVPDREDWLTLVDTGDLRNSIEAETEDNGRIFEVQVYSELPYASDMQKGSILSVGGNVFDVPARPFIFAVEPDDGDSAESLILGAIRG